MLKHVTSTVIVALIAMTAIVGAAFAASDYEGTWSVKDTHGKSFDITLTADGKATATHPKGMSGTWKEDSGAAVVTWNTGWTTKIAKVGDKYEKTTFRKGEPLTGKPAGTSDAVKK